MDPDLPPMSAWTYETVLKIVRDHEYEPGRYDYKTVMTPSKRDGGQKDDKYIKEHLASIRRTACSMANAEGGYILFGIQDRAEREQVDDEGIS